MAAGFGIGVEHAQQTPKSDIKADDDAQLDNLGVGEMLLEADEELVVINRIMVDGQLLGVSDGALFTRAKGRAVLVVFELGDFFFGQSFLHHRCIAKTLSKQTPVQVGDLDADQLFELRLEDTALEHIDIRLAMAHDAQKTHIAVGVAHPFHELGILRAELFFLNQTESCHAVPPLSPV